MSPRYLLDTNIWVHYLKGEFGIKERIQAVGLANCLLSEIIIAELLFGAANSAPAWQAQRRQEVAQIRADFAAQILPIGPALETYAEVKTHLRRLGRPVDSFDLLIGSTALFHGCTLVTRNTRHFADMVGIVLEDWVQEYESEQQAN